MSAGCGTAEKGVAMITSTGIAPMDRLLGGGIPGGNSVLFVSEPVVESGVFGLHLLSKYAVSGKPLLLLARMREDAVRSAMAQYGFGMPSFEVVDCYTALANEESSSKYVIENPRDFEEVRSVVLRAVDGNKGCFLFVDELNVFVGYLGEEKTTALVKEWTARLRELGGVGAFLYTQWKKENGMMKSLGGIFDCVVSLKALEKKVLFGQSFSVDKAGWAKLEPVLFPFKVISPGGVRVFIPKILVTGPYNAGKSSFIHTASTRAVSADRFGTTVALDHGHVDYKGFSVDLFGTPGQERFDPLLELLGGEAVGVVVVVDSTDPDSFPRAMEMLHRSNTMGIPFAIAANKAGLPGAMAVEEVRRSLGVDSSVPVIPVHAESLDKAKKLVGKVHCPLKKEDVNAVLDALFGEIFFRR